MEKWDSRLEVRVALKQLQKYSDASEFEVDALLEIEHIEGFGGREDCAETLDEAKEIALERLAWLRDMRSEGLI